MADHLVMLLRAALDAPDRAVAEHDLLTDVDRDRLRRWNDTARPHDPSTPVAVLFATQVARTPDAVVVEHRDRSIELLREALGARAAVQSEPAS